MTTPIAYLFLAAAVVLGIAGQLTLRSAAIGAPSLMAQLLNPLTIVGLGIYVFAAGSYIVALNRIPVTIAFPSVGASYAIIAVIAHFLWHEPLGWHQMGGIVLIVGGIFLLHQA